MLRRATKEKVSLKGPCRDQKSQQALSRGYKSRQAQRVDPQVADRRDLVLMLCCGQLRPTLGKQIPWKSYLKDLRSYRGQIHSTRGYKGLALEISHR